MSIFGGKVHLNKTRNSGPLYDYKLHASGAARALELMLPYLTTKGEQAALAIEFQSMQQTAMRRTPVTPEVAERKQWIADELKRLKRVPQALILEAQENNK